jgi:hypothetical protein
VNIYGTAYRCLGPLAERILILRRGEAVGRDGRTHTERIGPFRYRRRALIVPTDPAELVREPGYEILQQTIEVSTDFALQGPSNGVEPDQVLWHNTLYMVNNILPYSKFGVGFVTAVCQSVVQPKPPELGELPNRVFPGPPAAVVGSIWDNGTTTWDGGLSVWDA